MYKRMPAIALTLTAAALAGCGNLPGTTTPGGATDASITGRVTHLGMAPGQALNLSLKRFDGAVYQKIGTSTKTTNNGDFDFRALPSGKYQVFYDDQGEVVMDRDVNTVGAYVDAAVQVVELAAGSTPLVNFDVGWSLSPTIGPNGSYRVGSADRFSFSTKYGDESAEYQILVADSARSAVWSSAWGKTTSFAWNGNRGSETNSPSLSYGGSGDHFYQVKFRSPGTKFGGEGSYGQTKWIPFKVVR